MESGNKARKIAYLLTEETHYLARKYAALNSMRADLIGMCCIASVSLWQALSSLGCEAKLIHGKTDANEKGEIFHHCWVEMDGLVYDSTFNQFNYEVPFYIGCNLTYHKTFVHQKDIQSFGDFFLWTEEQQPSLSSTHWFVSRLMKDFQKKYVERVHQ